MDDSKAGTSQKAQHSMGCPLHNIKVDSSLHSSPYCLWNLWGGALWVLNFRDFKDSELFTFRGLMSFSRDGVSTQHWGHWWAPSPRERALAALAAFSFSFQWEWLREITNGEGAVGSILLLEPRRKGKYPGQREQSEAAKEKAFPDLTLIQTNLNGQRTSIWLKRGGECST